eukprot:TRINITY_DN67023_c0_g1_i1.p1 TRINITY_DN67023_c0_g1~~TRINITY_DN67023_c0_g1_i1.p1  ORF type:complete len:442 (-),score=95.78 TRINITY_DN67023_c0_g1_i1:123-1274(-)
MALSDDDGDVDTAGAMSFAKVSSLLSDLRWRSRTPLRQRFEAEASKISAELAAEADAASLRIWKAQTSSIWPNSASEVQATFEPKRGSYVFSLSPSEQTEEATVAAAEVLSHVSLTIGSATFARLGKAFKRTLRRAKLAVEAGGDLAHAAQKAVDFLEKPSSLWDLAFCVLCRYDALCGPGSKEGGGFHAAVPASVFEAAETSLGAGLESFASPLLCRRGSWHYCSLFNDLDIFFGSLGSFLDEELDLTLLGSITLEVNPPFVRGVVLRLAAKLHSALTEAAVAGRVLRVLLILPGLRQHSDENLRSSVEDKLGQLLASHFAASVMQPKRLEYTYGLAFKTDKTWPAFVVPTTVAILEARRPETSPSSAIKSATSLLHASWPG